MSSVEKEFDNIYNTSKVEIELNISKKEVLRYLGYKINSIVDDKTDRLIDECVNEVKEIARKNYSYRFYNIAVDNGLLLLETGVSFKGEDIISHLKDCSKCWVIAVTLGINVDNRLRLYNKTELSKALVFDACASVAIESLCDVVNSLIRRIASNNGFGITTRYSPGYGDLSLEHQRDILTLIEGGKIGLTCNDENILIPRKSITAIIGMGKDVKEDNKSCDICSFQNNCLFVKDGDVCATER